MALETPTAPTGTETQSLTPPPQRETSPKPPGAPSRIRNEYPQTYDELEELERSSTNRPEPPAKTNGDAKSRNTDGTFAKKTEPAEPKPEAKPPGAKDEPAPEPKTTDKPAPKDQKPTEKVEPDLDATSQFATAHELRKDWRKKKELLAERESEIANLRKQLDGHGPESQALRDENKKLRSRIDEVEAELRYADYSKSQEFKDKFEKPYQDAYDDAVEEVKELRVQTSDGQGRPATAQDFQRILQADTQDVRGMANEMFGEAAHDVLALRRRLVEMNKNANREAKRYRETAAEREREKTLKATEQREQTDRLWKKANENIVERYGEWFGARDGDEEYNTEREAGYAAVDRAFQPGLSVEERISRQAALRHRAAAFRTQVLLNRRLTERVKELEEAVKEYEKSAPGQGKGGTEGERVDAGKPRSAFDEIDELARQDPTDR